MADAARAHTAGEIRGTSWMEEFARKSLAPITEVRHGETGSVLLLAANVFLLLASYYLLKTVRESLILSEGGAEVKSYSSAIQALILLGAVPVYGWLASNVRRMQLVVSVTLFFATNLLIFAGLLMSGISIAVPFFIWVGIFNLFIVSQFWAFANDFYSEEQGKRLFPIVGLGSSIGALVGSDAASSLFRRTGVMEILLVATAVLAGSLLITLYANRRECAVCANQSARSATPLNKSGGFTMIAKDRYLLAIAVVVLLSNVVNTTGEYILGSLLMQQAATISGGMDAAAKGRFVGEFYGAYFRWVNLLGLGLQLFLVSRLFRWVGVRGALFALPLVSLGGYVGLMAAPLLAVARVSKVFENGVDYSVQSTTRQALFLPTSREAKYKAKAAVDTFFWRAGDLLQAGVVWVGLQAGFGVRQFATLNTLLVLAWLAVSVVLYRQHKQLTDANGS
ncbi:MAG TPA: hypothetical protein VES20_04100 [Bryobacteraceae bacterium]|nr:hypothetical protein [Bryobacteraceae bacterium]